MIPEKLKTGDEIRVVSPARSLSIISDESRAIANKRFEELGLKVSFSKHASESDDFNSSCIESRVEDLHEAFSDPNVKGILTTIGGFNSNQLLKYLNYDLIAKNPKILCGFSDITALSNAIYAKTGLVGYSGPHYSSFGMEKGFEHSLEYFRKCLMEEGEFEVKASKEWSDDFWWTDQKNRKFEKNNGYKSLVEGETEGTIIGGNVCTLNLLQGTEFMPSLEGTIVFAEDDEETKPETFDRDLQSLLHQPGFEKMKALCVGRFQRVSKVSDDLLEKIVSTKKELENIPVISGLDIGHATPMITFPIGGKAKIVSSKKGCSITITAH